MNPPETQQTSKPKGSSFLDPKKNIKGLIRIAVWVALVIAVLWIWFRYSGNPLAASNLGGSLTRKLVPWTERAEDATNQIIETNSQKLASSIQLITHPTGKQPKLANFQVRKVGEQLSVSMAVSWKGGLTSSEYVTRVVWEFDKNNQIRAKVTEDSAPFVPAGAKQLEEFFRSECYATLRSSLGD